MCTGGRDTGKGSPDTSWAGGYCPIYRAGQACTLVPAIKGALFTCALVPLILAQFAARALVIHKMMYL